MDCDYCKEPGAVSKTIYELNQCDQCGALYGEITLADSYKVINPVIQEQDKDKARTAPFRFTHNEKTRAGFYDMVTFKAVTTLKGEAA